jgi:phage-related tail protein
MRNDGQMRSIAEIEADMGTAAENLAAIDKEYREVSNRRTDAINRVNALQKEFDARVEGLRWSAPQNTDWRQTKARGSEAA